MFPGYTFNETDAKLYPSDGTCVYCEKNDSNAATNFLLAVFLEKGRTDLVVFRSVKYGALKIVIPRCKHCAKAQASVKIYGRLGAWSAVIITIVLGFLIGGVYGGLIAILAAIFGGIYAFTVLERRLLEAKGIPSDRAGAQKVPLVQELMADGWTLIAPSA